MRMEMIQKTQRPREGNVLGDIIRQVYDFLNEGEKNPDYELVSPINLYESIPAKEFLGVWGARSGRNRGFMVRPEKLPWDPNIKAVVSRGKKVLVETSKLDIDKVKELEASGKLGVEVRGRSFWYNGDKIVETYTRNVARQPVVDVRTVSTLLPKYGSQELEVAIDTLNDIDKMACYEAPVEGVESPRSLVVAQRMLQIPGMRQEMRQTLDQVQTPQLVMSAQQTACMIARRTLGLKVLEMNQGELDEFLRRFLLR